MPLKHYGVLKGRILEHVLATDAADHFQLLVESPGLRSRVAINVRSGEAPSEVEYLIRERFDHPILPKLRALREGFSPLASKPGGVALDFIRANLFDPRDFTVLPFDVPGPDNDLNEKFEFYVKLAEADPKAIVYAFGQRWQDAPGQAPQHAYFHPEPDNGVHDIHMNQGNSRRWVKDDGVWQDGAWLLELPSRQTWVGAFIKFQSQPWHTDDQTGHKLKGVQPVTPPLPGGPQKEPSFVVRIVAAVVNPTHGGRETVILLNTSSEDVSLKGWSIADAQKDLFALSGTIKAGDTKTIALAGEVQLSDRGGLITLLDPNGLKVHGVSYSRKDARHRGWTITF